MLDIRFVRDNAARVKEFTAQKGYTADIDRVLELDAQRRELQQKVDELRAKRNDISSKMKGGKPDPELIEQGKVIKTELTEFDERLRVIEGEFLVELKRIPNAPLDSVPIGSTEEENAVIRTVGEKPEFNFTPKNHWEIAEARGWIDKERAVKIAGARFVYLKGDLVRLEFALWQYGMDVLCNESILQKIIDENNLEGVSAKAFTPVLPPAMARTDVFQATGRLNKEEQTYKIEDEDLWLNASAEHTLAPMYLDEILPESELPIRLVGYTTAFRREAGTYGKDTEGIFRLHQFNKLEMESFGTAETSLNEHLFMVAVQEYLMQQLNLPYRVLEKCTADIGRPNAKGVDIDTWLPGQGSYRETHTADYITDYQARPMKTRVRRQNGEIELVHTNDATVFSERPLIAILENYQNEDNTVRVPEVLRSYLGGREVL
jgi:seryl-tRNA synthetase